MLLRSALITAIIAALTACTVVEETEHPYGRIGVAMPAPEVTLTDWTPPPQLGRFVLQGNLQAGDQDARLYRYVDPVYERDALEVVIYSFPGGWEDLPGDRVVDGHFPQVREAELTRLLRAHNSEVKEIRHDSQPLSGLEYPVAASSFVVEGARPATGSLLLLSAARPLFLRLRLAVTNADPGSRLDEAHTLLLSFRQSLPADAAK